MHSFLVPFLYGALIVATPFPQDIDLDMVDAAPQPTFTEAVGVTSQAVSYDTQSLFAQATDVNSVTVAVTDAACASTTTAAAATSLEKRGNCAAQPTGAKGAPTYTPDTPSAFASSPDFASSASAAPVPNGYYQAYSNLNSSSNAYGYLGFSTLQSYDSAECAARCNKINGCMAINIYFKRDPSVDPGPNCPNPSSVTLIKCAYWGAPVTATDAVNRGQYRQDFIVAIAGSNGYVNQSIATPPGYNAPTYLNNAAINAPYDSQGYNTYMGARVFTAGAFNATLCSTYCTRQSQYNLAHPPTDGSPVQTCQFFNTYILYINKTSNVQGQYCAIYSEAWPASYATNNGQYRESDHYLIEYSYSFTNSSNPGGPNKQGAIHQARDDITYSSLQPYCSSVLGYTVSTMTATAVSTITPISFTTTTSIVTTSIYTDLDFTTITFTTTVTASATVTVNAKRDVTFSSMPVISIATADYPNRLLPTELVVSILAANNKRTVSAQMADAASMPAVLTKYPATIIASACSLVASPAITTITTTVSTTSTAPTFIITQTAYTSTTVYESLTYATSTTLSHTVTITSTTTSHSPTATPTGVISFNTDKDHCGCRYNEYPGEYFGFYCEFAIGTGISFAACAEQCDFFGNCWGFSNGPDGCNLCSGNPDGFNAGAANEFSSSRLAGSCQDHTCQPPSPWGQGN